MNAARRASSVSLLDNSSAVNARVTGASYVDVARLDVRRRRRVPDWRRGYPLAAWGHSPLGWKRPRNRSRRPETWLSRASAWPSLLSDRGQRELATDRVHARRCCPPAVVRHRSRAAPLRRDRRLVGAFDVLSADRPAAG